MQALFETYNARYFAGKLSHYTVQLVEGLSREGSCGFCDRERQVIYMQLPREDQGRHSTLLHEMAHAATNRYHGSKWRAEMRRLAGAGAPVNLNEVTPGSTPRENFLMYATLFVADFPDGSLEQFVQFLLTHSRDLAEWSHVSGRSPLQQWPRLLSHVLQEARARIRMFPQHGMQDATAAE